MARFAGTLQRRLIRLPESWPPGTKLPFGGSAGTILSLMNFYAREVTMSLIGNILPVSHIVLDLEVSSKKRLFEEAGLLLEN